MSLRPCIENSNETCANKFNYLQYRAVVMLIRRSPSSELFTMLQPERIWTFSHFLHTGPKFGQSILEILLRVWIHKVALF